MLGEGISQMPRGLSLDPAGGTIPLSLFDAMRNAAQVEEPV
jgi:hypothetical protein